MQRRHYGIAEMTVAGNMLMHLSVGNLSVGTDIAVLARDCACLLTRDSAENHNFIHRVESESTTIEQEKDSNSQVAHCKVVEERRPSQPTEREQKEI